MTSNRAVRMIVPAAMGLRHIPRANRKMVAEYRRQFTLWTQTVLPTMSDDEWEGLRTWIHSWGDPGARRRERKSRRGGK